MAEPDCAIIDQDNRVYYGVVKISGKEIRSTLLPFKDEEKALELYTHLVAHQDDWILCCHHLVRYQDKWLVVLEYSKNIVAYFRERMKGWESSNRNESEWFNYISEDFGRILRDVARIWAKSNKCIYTQDPIKSIFITNFGGRVKFLPNLNASDQPIEGDIDQLKYLMNYIVNMPFGSVIQNYQKFNMPNELSCFLTELNFQHLKYMSPAFLLDVPLFWRLVDKFHFIINLDHMLKRREIKWQQLEKCLKNLRKKYLYDWVLAVNCDPVFKSIYQHGKSSFPNNAYSSAPYVSVVRCCSNVYRLYNDYATQKVSDGSFSKYMVKHPFSPAQLESHFVAILYVESYDWKELERGWRKTTSMLFPRAFPLVFAVEREIYVFEQLGFEYFGEGTIVAPSGSYCSK